jgi:hypothetical protein
LNAPGVKCVRLTLDPHDIPLPPIYERLTRGSDLDAVRIANWNVADPPTTFLLWLRGDYERFDDVLAADENVAEYALLPLTDDTCYCFLSGSVAAPSRALFEHFTQGSLLTVPPVECHADGSSTFSIVGRDDEIEAAVEGVPAGVTVTVERVGEQPVAPDSVVGRLSARQREAVEVALAAGYYDVPRDATCADVAATLDCATATAAEHLKKAESIVLRELFARVGEPAAGR